MDVEAETSGVCNARAPRFFQMMDETALEATYRFLGNDQVEPVETLRAVLRRRLLRGGTSRKRFRGRLHVLGHKVIPKSELSNGLRCALYKSLASNALGMPVRRR